MPFQESQHYSLWSFPECPITYFFACPNCRKIWDFHLIHNYTSGSPLLKIPFRCPDCDRNGEAFAETKTGMVEEIKIALAANEIDNNKNLLNVAGNLPGLFRLNLKHAYLDMRVIAWETGGPAPFSETPPNEWAILEEFENRFNHIFRVIDSWWEDEPFMIEILNNRINKRMNNLINSSIDIPKKDLTSMPYNEYLDSFLGRVERRKELTPEIMLERPLQPVFPLDVHRGLLANTRWPWIFASEAQILFIDECKLFKKKNRKTSLFLTIVKARGGDLTALKKIIAWDYAWLTCPWVSELIRSQPYDFDIQEMLENGLTGRPGYFNRKQRPSEKASQKENWMQFLHDRFGAKLRDINKFFENVFHDKDEDGRQNYENIKKFRKKRLRK